MQYCRQPAVDRLYLAVIMAVVVAMCVPIVAATMAHNENKPKAHEPRQQSAPDCSMYHVEHAESEWDEVTETYPVNHAWNDCMGVGYK